MDINDHLNDVLTKLGVNILTGEAEGVHGLGRLLCDLNEDGVQVFAEFFGAPRLCNTINIDNFGEAKEVEKYSLVLSSNMNFNVNGKPAVASVMMTRDTLLEMAIFGVLLRQMAIKVIVCTERYMRQRPVYDEELNPVIGEDGKPVVRDEPAVRQFYHAVDSEDYAQRYIALAKDMGWSYRTIEVAGTAGTRNRHEMSGRID